MLNVPSRPRGLLTSRGQAVAYETEKWSQHGGAKNGASLSNGLNFTLKLPKAKESANRGNNSLCHSTVFL